MTKRIKKNRAKNRTKKYFGGATQDYNLNSNTNQNTNSNINNTNLNTNTTNDVNDNKGIFNIIGDKLSQYTGKAVKYAEEKGLRLLGLQKINNQSETNNDSTKNIDEIGNATSSAVKSISSDIVNVFDKGSAAIVENINDVLESPQVGESLNEAASETAEIGEKLLSNFNEKLSTPEFKEEAKEALKNVSDYAEIVVDSMDEPINNAVDQLNEAGTKAAAGAISGLVKVGTDALAAVPGAGAVIELGKIANDATAAVGHVVEATSQATETVSKVVDETSKNIEKGMDKLEEEKKLATQISNRTDKSINSFENPIKNPIKPIYSGGARKTKRRLFKRKAKSKRVRFSV